MKGTTGGSALSNNYQSERPFWVCPNPLRLLCVEHGHKVQVPCGRWRTCRACQVRKEGELRSRFLAGITTPPEHPRKPMFFTLTFPESQAPSESEAQLCWRRLVGYLRHPSREHLGEYGWVLQRQKNGTLHFHGVAQLPWFADGLAEWRQLIEQAGFGVQNKLVAALPQHAGYCASYISKSLAQLEPGRRAYGFSRAFPKADAVLSREERDRLLANLGAASECEWWIT